LSLQVRCLYPILLRHGSYFQYRFLRYAPGPAFSLLSADSVPRRYRHVLHGNSRLSLLELPADSGLLASAWDRLGIPGRFVPDGCGCTLLYDARYGMFLMDFRLELALEAPAAGAPATPYLALQAQLRELLVFDVRVETKPCAWALSLQEQGLSVVRAELGKLIDPAMIEVPPSMGYIISAFPNAADVLPDSIRAQVVEHFHSGDRLADRVPQMAQLPLAVHNGEVFLGWQSSTLWGIPEDTCDELYPVFLTIQLIYTLYSAYFLAQTEDLFEEIFYYDEERFRHLQVRTDRMLILVDKTVHDKDVFESKLRPGPQAVFESLWDYWGMKRMLNACEHSLNSSKRSLEMNINIIHEKMGERQNNLLFILAIIQIVAMMGVINDYLALNDRFEAISIFILAVLMVVTAVVFVFSYYERIAARFHK
jgi:hypothetical protein